MKQYFLVILSTALILNVTAQKKNFWKGHNPSEKVIPHKSVARSSFPKDFKLFDVDDSSFNLELLSITDKKTSKKSTIVSLPNAAGELEDFELVESSNFELDLQARFPQIRAYSGRSISKPGSTIKVSISPEGLQTMVFRADDENEFIEQYSNNKKVYAVFKSQRKPGAIPWNCSTTEKQMVNSLNTQATALSLTTARSGGNIRTLRLAQSCNAEYSNYFGATKAADSGNVIAAFNATLTRCNGVYEKDLAIHLNLIANTTKVIYYTASSDPYSTMGNWNSELQSTLTAVIGEANYDIGHMFGASGGGGNAGCIGCICVNGSKGSGITSPGDGVPQGDNFDIDYVAHEIGHQLGGNHTFSMSNEGTGVNMEVGSGITIMGYAGITSQDVAPHSIDIFHQASIAQIQTNLSNKTGCGLTPASNSAIATPVVTVPKASYTIPKSTPFSLTGSATDANTTDVLTYCWEQNDNARSTQTGSSSVASAAKLTGPNWISFSPSTSPTRLFPKLSTILAGATVSGPLPGGDAGANTEALSSVARTLNFRLTVRDNAPFNNSANPAYSIGQTSYADVAVTVNGTAGPFAVTAPNTAISWKAGSTQTITWSVNSTNLSPVSCAKVKISLSTDGGNTFPTVLSDSTANDGSEALVMPNSVSSTARIKIEAVGNIFFDISNANFTISQPSLCGDVTGLNSSSITNNSATISWAEVNGALSYAVDYKLSTTNTWTSLSSSQQTTSANLSGLLANSTYNWRVRSTCNAGNGDSIQASFTTLPNCGTPTGLSTTAITGTSATLNWGLVSSAINYRLEYKLNSAANWTIYNDTQTLRSVSIKNLLNSTTYNWRVSARCGDGLGSSSVTTNFTTLCQSRYDSSTNGTLAGAATIPFNTNINGLINVSGDIDNYKIVFTKGGTITITLTNLIANYNIKLLNGAGTQVAISQKSNKSNESISYSVTPGTYYAQVYGASSSIFNASNCYVLKVALGTAAKTLDALTSARNNANAETIELNHGRSVVLYPNPVKEKLNIQLNGIDGISDIFVYNASGEKMISSKTDKSLTSLDFSMLKVGYYTIKVINNNKIVSSLKVIKL